MQKPRQFLAQIGISIASAVPWTLLLAWMGTDSNARRIQNLWNREHPLNLGGNPMEVYSHLLNVVVFQSGTFIIAMGLLPWRDRLAPPPGRAWVRITSGTTGFLSGWLGIAGMAVVLDGRHGEGATFAAIILFLPTLLGIQAAFDRFGPDATPGCRIATAALLPAAALASQRLFEPSETGAPGYVSLVVLPALVAAAWAAAWLGHRWGIRPR